LDLLHLLLRHASDAAAALILEFISLVAHGDVENYDIQPEEAQQKQRRGSLVLSTLSSKCFEMLVEVEKQKETHIYAEPIRSILQFSTTARDSTNITFVMQRVAEVFNFIRTHSVFDGTYVLLIPNRVEQFQKPREQQIPSDTRYSIRTTTFVYTLGR